MSRRVFFDLNVLLDVLTCREPFFEDAAELWTLAERRRIEGVISAMSLPTAYYLLRRAAGRRKALSGLKAMRSIFEIVELDATLIDQAIAGGFADFEDGVQACSALRAEADCIVTRDARGFRKSDVPAVRPAELLASLETAE